MYYESISDKYKYVTVIVTVTIIDSMNVYSVSTSKDISKVIFRIHFSIEYSTYTEIFSWNKFISIASVPSDTNNF